MRREQQLNISLHLSQVSVSAHGATAGWTAGRTLEPRVDTVDVEGMAAGQQPHLLA